VGAGAQQSRQYMIGQLFATVPRLLRTYDALATARYALTPRWELQAGVKGYAARYNEDTANNLPDGVNFPPPSVNDFQSSTWDLGASYRSPRGNSTGFRFRYQQGRWPNRTADTAAVFGGEYQQYTLSAVLDWLLSQRSHLYGDIGYTARARQDAQQGDFNGPSGRLTYDYSLSGKTTLRTSIYQIRGPTEIDFASYVRTTGLTFNPIYELTGKIELTGTVAYSEVDYLGGAQAFGQQAREFQYWTLGANGVYRITRSVNLNAGVSYYWRTSNLPGGDYQGFTANLSVGTEF
jgi:hypothetical protein